MAAALTGHRYAMATVDAIGAALLILPLAGSLYIVTGLARRAATMGLRWSTGHPTRRLLAAAVALACCAALAAFWTLQGQFRGW